MFYLQALMLRACGSLCGAFVPNPLEGYRILVPNKITQNQRPKPKTGAGIEKSINWWWGVRLTIIEKLTKGQALEVGPAELLKF
jgi:hypothetical protein